MSTETRRGQERKTERRRLRSALRGLLNVVWLLPFLGALTPLAHAGKPQVQAVSPAAELAGKARALDLRGRYELARQTWEQVLQLDPENAEALGGVVHCLRAEGRDAEAGQFLEHARAAHPGNSVWAKLAVGDAGESKSAELHKAEQLSRQGRFAEAMVLYRRLYGANPPAGEASLAYYAAEGETDEGRPQAIAGLRALNDQFPEDARYRRALGSLLLQNVRTHSEGQKLLGAGRGRKAAVLLAGNSAPPASSSPTMAEPEPVNQAQAQEPVHPVAASVTPARPQPLSLRAALPAADPPAQIADNISDSKPAVPSDKTVEPPGAAQAVPRSAVAVKSGARAPGSPASAEMERAAFAALNGGRLHEAETKFKVLLARNGDNARASGGLGLVRVREANWSEAVPLLERAERDDPGNPAFARGLRQARAATGAVVAVPANAVAPAVGSHELATAALHVSSRNMAETRSPSALVLPRRTSATASGDVAKSAAVASATPEVKLSQASALAAAGDDRAASALFEEVAGTDTRQAAAWAGLIASLHRQKKLAEALNVIDRMPRDVLQATLQTPEFAADVAAIEEQEGRAAAARQVLESLLAQAAQPPGKAYGAAQLQLGRLLLQDGQPAQAYGVFRASVANAPDSLNAWAGLMAALHATGHDREALEQLSTVSPALRVQMESDPLFLQTAPLLYAGVNDQANALAYWSRLQQFAAAEHTPIPLALSLEVAKWLGQIGDEPHLYQILMSLGKRADLNDAQRRAVQQVWAAWAVQQATEQARHGNTARATSILSAASTAFAANREVQRTLALGYASANLPRNALAMLRTQDLSHANADDLSAAVNAALAVRDQKQAEVWLRPALVQYPTDPDLLLLASRFETEAGHKKESTAYYQAALTAAQARQRALPAGLAEQTRPVELSGIAPAPGSSPDLAKIFAEAKSARGKPTELSSAEAGRLYLPGSVAVEDAFPRRDAGAPVSR